MNLLNDYTVTREVIPSKEFMQDAVLDIILDNMVHSIAKFISKRKKELPDEDCLFVLTCKIYKYNDFLKVQKGGDKYG